MQSNDRTLSVLLLFFSKVNIENVRRAENGGGEFKGSTFKVVAWI